MSGKYRVLPRRVFGLFLLPHIIFICVGYVPLVSADPEGFVSINCGGPNKTTIISNITWISDTHYTVLGSISKVKVNASPPYDTLRYFPDVAIEKYCFVLNTTVDSRYLLRAGFLYGNYDGRYVNSSSKLPSFSLLLDANEWTTVSFDDVNETVLHDLMYLATQDSASVCVARSDKYDPFISSLEIRKLPQNDTYAPLRNNQLMKTNSRINFGDNTSNMIRYPDDLFDRIWLSDSTAIQNISIYGIISNGNITDMPSLKFPPPKVMQTARSPDNSTSMYFDFTASHGPGQYYLSFYFDRMNDSIQMLMNASVNNNGLQTLNVSGPLQFTSDNYTLYSNNYNLYLSTNDTSKRPYLNAAESYFLQSINFGTSDEDVNALKSIQTVLNLSSWTGDPCVPNKYKWSWINCSTTAPVRIISLDLSSKGLRSLIPSTFANLSALTHIDLHNNSLFGGIPQSLVDLQNLTFLDLSNNNLSGSIPEFRPNITLRLDGNIQLCQNCEPVGAPEAAPATPSSNKEKMIILVSVFAAIISGIMLACGIIIYRRMPRKNQRLFSMQSAHWPPVPRFTEISRSGERSAGTGNESSIDVPVYSFDEMMSITKNFCKMLPSERVGSLFHGILPGGEEVVVKLLPSNIKIPPVAFLSQARQLSGVNHRNLLRPIGFCAESHRLMFMYEHMQRGSLYDHLYNCELLDWKARFSIILQAGQGLEYLHHGCRPPIIHGNLKSRNVLLGGDGTLAKISDFAIYSLSPNVDATSGYLDPQYFVMNCLNEKSDVYSFGVLILEVVCGRTPFDTNLSKEACHIVDWVRKTLLARNYEQIVDPCLHGSWNVEVISKIVQLALAATKEDMNERPTMSEISMELKDVYKVEQSHHHVAFAKVEMPDYSSSPEFPLTMTYANSSTDHDPTEE